MPYEVNARVRRKDRPDEEGVVIGVHADAFDDEVSYRVRFGHQSSTCFAEDLIPAAEAPTDPWEALSRGLMGPARDLRTLLTWERLRRPMGPVGSAFGTARVKLYPYQLKPLVKFLDSPHHGLLIADEVGLGKTIEAGYILREWGERHALETVLVVVPARLRTKWRDELKRRFEMDFTLVSGAEVLHHLRAAERMQQLGGFRWIASYESLRSRALIEQVRALSPAIDLLILDEAHRVRNRDTWQYRAIDALRRSTMALLLLTATPVQTGLANLHTLLDLLEPGAFGSPEDFAGQVEANRPVLEATRAAAAGEFQRSAGHLERLSQSPLTRRLHADPAVQALIVSLRTSSPSRSARVAMQAAIGELSLTGHLVTRTRKVEVFEHRSVRRARSIQVQLTATERLIYQAARDVTALLLSDRGSWALTLATLTALRYTASCIPAGHAYLIERLQKEGLWLGEEAVEDEDDIELNWDEDDVLLEDSEALLRRVRARLATCPQPGEDSKLIALRRALMELWREDAEADRPARKVILFSFFKRTLAYLDGQLRRWQVQHERIDGGVPLPEREERIERFQADPAIRVLLSSEVGGEGLDLQRASVVINYDLPWNPMVVEQRIGRVDRIGQESPTILILNLVYAGTIEDRILNRLYERLRLYEESVGDLEEILGPRVIAELVRAEVRGELTEAELERRVEQARLAVERGRQDARSLSDQVDGLVSADQAILDQLRELVEGRRLPTPGDVAELLSGFLSRSYPGSLINGDPTTGVAGLELPAQGLRDLQSWSDQHSRAGHALLQRLRGRTARFTLDGDVALRHPSAEFVQTRHALVQFAVDSIDRRSSEGGRAFAVRLVVPSLHPGPWLVGLWTVTRVATSEEAEVVGVACHLSTGELLVGESAGPLVAALLETPAELELRPSVAADELETASLRLRREFARELRRSQQRAVEVAERRAARRRATWEATMEVQVEKARGHVLEMQAKGKPFPLRMAEAKLKLRQAELEQLREGMKATVQIRLDNHEIAAVLALVETR